MNVGNNNLPSPPDYLTDSSSKICYVAIASSSLDSVNCYGCVYDRERRCVHDFLGGAQKNKTKKQQKFTVAPL